MKSNLIFKLFLTYLFALAAVTLAAVNAFGQSSGAPGATGPQYAVQGTVASAEAPAQSAVSYSSMTQLNDLLGRIQATSKQAQSDLAQLRIEHWKTDSAAKKQALADVDSIQRNLQDALPAMIGQLRNSPEDLQATFKLYRNLDALYSVMGGVVESAGAFGPKDDFQSLSNDLSAFESGRKQLAERLETLAGAKEQEIARLRAELKTAQAQAPVPPAPPKKVIVDDTQPEKKPEHKARKKTVTKKKPATTTPASTSQTPQTPPKPQ
ncbi:MAG TPA: hypothetical protein VMF10_10390 [Candidatus Aquilonibacter sp.]|nr:hypothetical protein [Candidatus Aquilonibacter sp.]